MRLAQAIVLHGGGPGSGCHGPNCGRHPEHGQFRYTGTNKHQDSHTNYYVGPKTVVKHRVGDTHKVYEMNPVANAKDVGYKGDKEGASAYLLSRYGIVAKD